MVQKARFFILILLATPIFASAASVSVVISEVMFNPSGVDTGFEYLVIENRGSDLVDLTGWHLYPDGIGYYTFPSFSLAAASRVKIYLRTAGQDASEDLYFAGAAGNMGNTSGSIALFSGTDHNETTLVDFVQYGRAGETWESAAESAGLWIKGQFVPIDSTLEGNIIKRKDASHGISSWEFVPASSESSPPPNTGNTNASSETSSSGGGKVYSGPTVVPHIKAYAGPDQQGVAGAEVIFEGKALGWEDDLISGPAIRFLWNFGDGASQEGIKVGHTYQFPGTYTATLYIASGEDSARDDAKVMVNDNPVFVSEVLPGEGGWAELTNPSSSPVDISRWRITSPDGNFFELPDNSFIDAHAFVVFPREATKLVFPSQTAEVKLFTSNAKLASSLKYGGVIPAGMSFSKNDSTLAVGLPTPGGPSQGIKTVMKIAASETKSVVKSLPKEEKEIFLPPPPSQGALANEEKLPLEASVFQSNLFWLLGSIGAGLIAGVSLLLVKKFLR